MARKQQNFDNHVQGSSFVDYAAEFDGYEFVTSELEKHKKRNEQISASNKKKKAALDTAILASGY